MSCSDNDKQRKISARKDAERQDVFFQKLNKAWQFSLPQPEPAVATVLQSWPEWRIFASEISAKPVTSLSAFRKKAAVLAAKTQALQSNVPIKFSTPEIKSRIAAVLSRVRMLDLYLSLQQTPAERITPLFPEINASLNALNLQFSEIVKRDLVPIEKGESDMLRMLDTTRAIKSDPTLK